MGAEFTALLAGLDMLFRTLADRGIGPQETQASDLFSEVLPSEFDIPERVRFREGEESGSGVRHEAK